ncbi:unnamed protein product [Adineta ricciae]|uniref:Uncharacterized protein n=1 Tax=Adineta ricciae TaxID=249248 RepID=A0A813ZNV1_ADIRI|nr:unnamed protein product [Adineta ricciae]
MALYQKTLEQFESLLKCDMIDMKRLKILAFNGCPAENGIRSLTWKILLNYLVLDRTKWSSHLSKQRELYRGYIRETIIKPGLTPTTESDVLDHPLNSAPDSSWAVYFKENEVLLQIDKDVRRLCPDLSFFQRETDYACAEILNQEAGFESLRKRIVSTALKVESQSRSRLTGRLEFEYQNKASQSSTTFDDNEYQLLPDGHEAHWEVVERILFVFSKLNSGQSYVQGMNEIIGPIYYTFATDPNPEWREHAEADAFYCFTNLMIHIRDNFMKIYDHSEFGILVRMQRLLMLLKRTESDIYYLFEKQKIKPEFYAFRWLTLLLSQEFRLPDVLRIWDSLFADQERNFEFLLYICCAMIVLQKNRLLSGSESQNIKLLQGRQIIAKRNYQQGELIFEEQPLVLAQFEWNKLYKYSACEYCLYPLESCEQNVRRLCQDTSIVIPYPECDPNQTISQRIVRCPKCNEMYCSAGCYHQAMNSYHSTLCQSDETDSKVQLIRQIIDLWRSAHPPPETTSISLVLKLMAMLKQAKLQKFSQGVQSENQRFYHKLLRKEFQSQVEHLRQALSNFNEQYIQIEEFRWFLTPDGFRQLLALLGRNQQGVGTSPLAVWVKNCENLPTTEQAVAVAAAAAAAAASSDISQLIDAIYTKIDDVSGEFIDCEGSGLFKLQSCLNHSCDANAEIQYRHNNSTLSVVATRSISSNEEITINYLSECDRNRSRHSRQKLLQENYLFLCQCSRCVSEASELDETSEDDDDDDEMDEN